jgi:hypothetical protein
MKRIVLAIVGALLLNALLPAHADAQEDATVSVFDGASHSINAPNPITFCFDGEGTNMELGDLLEPESIPAGTYTLEIHFGFDEVCGDAPDFEDDFTFAGGDDVTVFLTDTSDFLGIAVLDNDTTCVEPGTGRVTVRNGAFAGTVDLESDGEVLVAGVDENDQGAADVDEGDYPASEVLDDEDGVVADLGEITINEGENLIVYVVGGADGPTGAFTDVVDLDVCTQPTTTTVAPVAPAAPVAAVTAATPSFTG